jgi:hypothetical protein
LSEINETQQQRGLFGQSVAVSCIDHAVRGRVIPDRPSGFSFHGAAASAVDTDTSAIVSTET